MWQDGGCLCPNFYNTNGACGNKEDACLRICQASGKVPATYFLQHKRCQRQQRGFPCHNFTIQNVPADVSNIRQDSCGLFFTTQKVPAATRRVPAPYFFYGTEGVCDKREGACALIFNNTKGACGNKEGACTLFSTTQKCMWQEGGCLHPIYYNTSLTHTLAMAIAIAIAVVVVVVVIVVLVGVIIIIVLVVMIVIVIEPSPRLHCLVSVVVCPELFLNHKSLSTRATECVHM